MDETAEQRLASLIMEFNWGELERLFRDIGHCYVECSSDREESNDMSLKRLPDRLASQIYYWAENVIEDSSDE